MPVALAFALLLAAKPAAATPPIVGKWGVGGEVLFDFQPGGKGVAEGEPFRWRVQGTNLVILSDGEEEVMPFQLSGDTLVLVTPAFPLQLQRIGGRSGKGAAPAPAAPFAPGTAPFAPGLPPGAAQPPPLAGNAPKVPLKDPLAQLLLSSAWCTFRYNQTTGYSSSSRVQFSPNGTYSTGAQGEGYSSGAGGTWGSQSNSAGGGQWTVKKGVLYLNAPPAQPDLVPLPLQVKRNSSGYPIIVTGEGVEYSQCQ